MGKYIYIYLQVTNVTIKWVDIYCENSIRHGVGPFSFHVRPIPLGDISEIIWRNITNQKNVLNLTSKALWEHAAAPISTPNCRSQTAC
jgi:hypothetical protein